VRFRGTDKVFLHVLKWICQLLRDCFFQIRRIFSGQEDFLRSGGFSQVRRIFSGQEDFLRSGGFSQVRRIFSDQEDFFRSGEGR
jgi:hypothetical protein